MDGLSLVTLKCHAGFLWELGEATPLTYQTRAEANRIYYVIRFILLSLRIYYFTYQLISFELLTNE